MLLLKLRIPWADILPPLPDPTLLAALLGLLAGVDFLPAVDAVRGRNDIAD
jgi:hypothetical protein